MEKYVAVTDKYDQFSFEAEDNDKAIAMINDLFKEGKVTLINKVLSDDLLEFVWMS